MMLPNGKPGLCSVPLQCRPPVQKAPALIHTHPHIHTPANQLFSAALEDPPLVTYHQIFEGSLQDRRERPEQTNASGGSKQTMQRAEENTKSKNCYVLREVREDIVSMK